MKIGYISPNFCFHPVGVLINQILPYHNPSEFEIYCYSLLDFEDEYRDKIKENCDYFVDVSSLDNSQIAKKIKEDGINILIDLAGYTNQHRREILALQPAPVQIQYLGYPNTTGENFLPYLIADQHLIPPHLASNYSEKIIYLPYSWITSPVDFPRHRVSRIDYGLPATGLVFCNFNISYELNPSIFPVWGNILKNVPRSVLWLADAGEKAQKILLKCAEELGINQQRIIFAPHLPYEDYLARYQVADLILDSFPENGCATTLDALKVGLPILTLSGESYVSRMGYSICQGVGLTELICHSLSEYEEKAISIGNNPGQLVLLKHKLAVALQQSDLFKPQVFVSHLETALKNLYHSPSHGQIYGNEPISAANTEDTITNIPTSGSSFFEQGKYLRQQGNLSEAIKAFQSAIALTPNFIEAFHQLGLIYQSLDNWEGAKNIYERALEIEEENPLTLANLGIVHQKINEEEKAIFYYQRALSIRPDFYQVYYNLSQLYVKNNQYTLAENLLLFALQVCPTWAEIYLLLGNLYTDLGERKKAINSYQSAINNNSDLLKAYYPLGALLLDGGNAQELELAEKVLKTAISKDMNYSEAYFALGILCEYSERKEEAMIYYQQAFNLQPLGTNILYRLAHLKLQICQWDNYEEEVHNLISYTERELTQGSNTVLEPLTLSAFPLPLLLQKRVALRRSEQIKNLALPYQKEISPISSLPKSSRIKVGYVSPDFCVHGVSTLIYKIFEYHSRPEFEVFAYSLFPTIEDEFQQIIRQNCDHYRDVSQLLPVAIAQQIQRDEISILIDLGGYTRHSKPEIFALQPAPIQIHYLGFPSTMGADFLPYIIADEILIPPSLQSCYSEKVLYLPQGWMVSPIEIKEKSLTRQDYGLPESGFIYGNFNTSYKLNPPIFKLWMEILAQVPESVLWLNSVDGMGNDRLRKFAENQGINPERLIFARRLPYQQHLARCQVVDLFLDTFPYNGGATTVDILRAGVPLVTCYGDSYVSRMGASLCYGMGLDELVCDSFSSYAQSAIALGQNPSEILKLKEKISKAKIESPLFKPQIFITHWETMLRQKYQTLIAEVE